MSSSAAKSSESAKAKANDERNTREGQEEFMTILGVGSLLSEKSSRLTFPTLHNFRLGRIEGYRRVFRHTPASFLTKGIASVETKEMASLSAEKADGFGFVCAVFEVPSLLSANGIPSPAFREREEAFTIETNVEYHDLLNDEHRSGGVLCTSSTDEAYIEEWGQDRFNEKYGSTSLKTLWGWGPDSGILPCRVYMRHCVLCARRLGPTAYDSFLDETYLIDRQTTVRAYLSAHPGLLNVTVPKVVANQYGGE